MSRKHKMSRRKFLHMSALAATGAAVASCSKPDPEIIRETVIEKETVVEVQTVIEKETVIEEVPVGVAEPPRLADRVASGELPPLDERLPVSPVVVGGREAIGEYGGEVRIMNQGWNWFTSLYGWTSERMLHYSDSDLRTIIPNILESWEMSGDGKTITIYMREGMKWSDGVPVTTKDFAFWWFDFATNEEVGWASWHWRHGGEQAEVEIVDDFTFKVTFAASFGQFPAHLTRWFAGQEFLLPRHYLEQFHADYADEAELTQKVADRGFDTWAQLFGDEITWGVGCWMATENVMEYPTLSPWMIVEMDWGTALFISERNPYYWKVDQLGNQLPYIDDMRVEYASDNTIVTQKIVQGELDYVGPHDVTIARYPLYKENEPGNAYIVADMLSCMIDRYVLFPQHYLSNDEVLTEIVQHPNFVRALSLAIDREEVNQSLFFGLARMGGMAPMPSSKYYKEAYGTAWAQFDPDKANELLDEMGLDQRDGDGFRLRPDGERLRYNIEHAGVRVGVVTGEYTEMVSSYWRDIGIDATTREEDEDLITERLRNGEVHCTIWHADRCTDLLMPLEMDWFIPLKDQQGGASVKWAQWFNAADREAEGLVEPPDYIKQLYDWYAEMNTVIDENERVAIGQKIFDWLADRPLEIGSVLECPAPIIFNKGLRNLPRPKSPIGWDTYGISTYHPEAFYYEGGKRAS